MDKKLLGPAVDFKLLDQAGQFRATFSLLNVKDLDGDVTLPGAFQDGQEVRLSQWGHNWAMPAIGKGIIHADQTKAWVDGEFFLTTQAGKDTYEVVKGLGGLQQWSYGFDITKHSFGDFQGQQVRFLEGLNVHEVSPVMLGAQPLTSTDEIKEAKTGARNAAADLKRMQSIHDTLVELGVECASSEPKGHAQDWTEGKAEDPPAGKAEDRTDGKAKGPSPLALRIAAELLDDTP